MISFWWIIPSFFSGVLIGVVILALCASGSWYKEDEPDDAQNN